MSFLLSMFVGVHLVCFAVISGLAALIIADHAVWFVLLLASSAYLGYLALKIALAGTKLVLSISRLQGLSLACCRS